MRTIPAAKGTGVADECLTAGKRSLGTVPGQGKSRNRTVTGHSGRGRRVKVKGTELEAPQC
jgi:hypothetical protein